MSRFGDAVNEQVGHEFAASQQYIAIAVHYDTQTLPNLAAHFYRQALEERNHAMMLVQYLLDADEDVVIPGVEAPRTEFDDIVAPVELALAQEREVTEQIKGLVRIARDDGELVGEQFLHWFLEEQREEVSSMSALLATVQRAGETNVLLVEEALARGTATNAGRAGGERPAGRRRRALASPGAHEGLEQRFGRGRPRTLVERDRLDHADRPAAAYRPRDHVGAERRQREPGDERHAHLGGDEAVRDGGVVGLRDDARLEPGVAAGAQDQSRHRVLRPVDPALVPQVLERDAATRRQPVRGGERDEHRVVEEVRPHEPVGRGRRRGGRGRRRRRRARRPATRRRPSAEATSRNTTSTPGWRCVSAAAAGTTSDAPACGKAPTRTLPARSPRTASRSRSIAVRWPAIAAARATTSSPASVRRMPREVRSSRRVPASRSSFATHARRPAE